MADLSTRKTLVTLKTGSRLPVWIGIPARVLLLTFVGTLTSFAISLLLAILAAVSMSRLPGTHLDMRITYRYVALPMSLVAAGVIFVAAIIMEVRNYRQTKTLQAIERLS